MTFEEIYKEFFKPIYSYILTRVRNEAAAQDIAATTWRKAFEKLDAFDESRGNMRQWLFGIARNEVNMHYRLYYDKKVLSLTGFEDSPAAARGTDITQELIYEDEKRLLLSAMSGLKDKERDILALKFYSGLNNRQIAGAVNISESNAGTIINRSINKLRVLLEAK
ncbi:MAG: sigma-70 family RNA polymerase sigma factor [Elusimicrobiota bacterium]|jgi:RNA polymerase sigma-70 factor (ECF subfamily)|nr:sigma-70 family RNA polymerase sigma factor [Elusimicrobiota bacterium]